MTTPITPIPPDKLAGEVLWGIENAKLLSTEKKLEFLAAIKEGRFEEIRQELADAMEAETHRVTDEIDALNRDALSFITQQKREIDEWRAEHERKPFLGRLFAWAFK